MFFSVVEQRPSKSPKIQSMAFLEVDNWDDWGKYRTTFTLHVADENGTIHTIGSVKIGQKGLLPATRVTVNHRAPMLPDEFNKLPNDFFSLGQGEDYYESLNNLSDKLRKKIFAGLRDCAADLEIFAKFENEVVMTESLLRAVRASNVTGRLNRLIRGDAKLTRYAFTYTFPPSDDQAPAKMDFEVIPESQPPSNVHALIGRNGVGKTQCMRLLALSLLGRQTDGQQSPGTIDMTADDIEGVGDFAGLILVSFSAFDDFDLRPQETDSMTCQQVGLRTSTESGQPATSKSFDQLSKEFANSLYRCQSGVTTDRWRAAVSTLEEDDLFAEADVTSLLGDETPEGPWKARARKLFKRLSSGHAIVLLTITRLVELVDERTLVLLDEPEGHLHPPLLASFIRCLSDLLFRRNGVAIIATHSPVVLQEIPRTCAWKLRRSRAISVAERPTIQTFGENIGVLTREVFGHQVTKSGFHHLLAEAVASGKTYEMIVDHFNGQLGDEAKAILQALIAERYRESDA